MNPGFNRCILCIKLDVLFFYALSEMTKSTTYIYIGYDKSGWVLLFDHFYPVTTDSCHHMSKMDLKLT